MEREYKWQLPEGMLASMASYLHGMHERIAHDMLRMEAIYYDTADGLVYQNGAALRLRRENGRGVCCMKCTVQKEGALAIREEYEVAAETLLEGLERLPGAGAPAELCALLAEKELVPLAKTEFIRSCYLLEIGEERKFRAEFAVDVGTLGGTARMEEFEELELEYKSGDIGAFEEYAEKLARVYRLMPQPASKLARAIAVGKAQ